MLVISISSFSLKCFLLYYREKSSFQHHLICCLRMLSIWSHPKCCLVKSLGSLVSPQAVMLLSTWLSILVAPPMWLSCEHVWPMTWWLWVRSPIEADFPSGVLSPLTSAEACEKSSRWLWIEKLVLLWESQEIHVRHQSLWYELNSKSGNKPQYN